MWVAYEDIWFYSEHVLLISMNGERFLFALRADIHAPTTMVVGCTRGVLGCSHYVVRAKADVAQFKRAHYGKVTVLGTACVFIANIVKALYLQMMKGICERTLDMRWIWWLSFLGDTECT